MTFRKPPDKYKTIKCQLLDILTTNNSYKDKNVLQTINDTVIKTNKIIIKSYILLRLYIVKKYENNIDIPFITEDVIKMSFNAMIDKTNKKGKISSGSNLTLLNELKNLYISNISDTFEDSSNLSSILGYYSTTIITSIENNIKNNFINYINRFVNLYIKTKYENEMDNKDTRKQLYNDIKVLKNDIIENKQKCNIRYHEWLITIRDKIVPTIISDNINIYKLLNDNPQSFFKYMIYMNIEIEKLGKKQFQFFPLQNNIILKHIQIDTKGLIELFEDNKTEKFKTLSVIKPDLWNNIFNINKKINKYSFDYTIITDGFSVSLRFINNANILNENIKKQKMKAGRIATSIRLSNLTKEQKNIERELNKIKRNTKIKTYIPTISVVSNTETLNSLETLNSIEPNNIENNKIKKRKSEFNYIDDVDKCELGIKHIFIDPGKRSLFTMIDDNNEFLKYTNSEHMSITKRLKYQKRILNYKDNKGVIKIENELSSFNSKSCTSINFIDYIKKKLEINNKLIESYNDIKYRKYKWYSYINKKRAEDTMLNKIENKYSKEHIIIIGDWSIGKQMNNFISTPNITLKRKLLKRFKVFNIDEFRTSCLHNETEELCKHLKLSFYNKRQKKITSQNMHSILTYQMENKRLGCIDRDLNGCLNIKKIFKHYITTGLRPERYKRGYILPTIPTIINI